MGVKKIVKHIKDIKGWENPDLVRATGISKQMIFHWQKFGATSIAIKHLVALKRASGMTWSQMGKMLEELDDKGA